MSATVNRTPSDVSVHNRRNGALLSLPAVAELELAGHDYSDPGKPRIAWDDDEARQQLVTALVDDTLTVLAATEGLELDGAVAEAVGLLALVAGQDVEPGDRDGCSGVGDPLRRTVAESSWVTPTPIEARRRLRSELRARRSGAADPG